MANSQWLFSFARLGICWYDASARTPPQTVAGTVAKRLRANGQWLMAAVSIARPGICWGDAHGGRCGWEILRYATAARGRQG